MAERGVVAVDPLRLAELEDTVHALGETCRQSAFRTADDLWGTGESAMAELADLHGLAGWAARRCEDLARRRRILEALPEALPLPAWPFSTPAVAEARGSEVGAQLRVALLTMPLRWPALEAALVDAARGVDDPTFAVWFLRALGADLARQLTLYIEVAARDEGVAPPDTAAALGVLHRALAAASQLSEAGLDPSWTRRFAGLPARAPAAEEVADPEPEPAVARLLRDAGLGLDMAEVLARGIRGTGLGVVATGGGTVLTFVGLAVALEDGIDVEDVVTTALDAVGGLTLAAVGIGAVATPLGTAVALAVAGGASLASWVLGNVVWPADTATPENRHRRSSRAYDPDTGTSHYPGGGTDRPHQDGAGGVADPRMTR